MATPLADAGKLSQKLFQSPCGDSVDGDLTAHRKYGDLLL